MDFPKRNFPYMLNQHEKRREIFAEFGTISGIDVQQNNGILEFIAHKGSSEMKNRRLFSKRPTLPLYPEPEEASFPYRNRIMDDISDMRTVSTDFIHNVKYVGQRNKEVFNKEIENFLKRIEKFKKLEPKKSRFFKLEVPKKVEKIINKYKQCKYTQEVKNMNSSYTGGCLSWLPGDSGNRHILLSPCGRNFDILKISFIDVDNSLCTPVNVHRHDVGMSMYEIQGNLVHNKGYCAVRGELTTRVYMMDTDQSADQRSPTLIQEMSFTDSRPTSVCLSPYIPGECLTVTDDGTVKLWTVNNRCDVVVDKQSHRFECYDQWRQCRFGAHPRQVVLADNTAVQILDIRTSSGHGTDLFALPSKYLNKTERIRVVEQHPISPFLYVIATDYSMCLVDLRFPDNPLLQWQHLLRKPPSYISCLTNVGQENHNHVFIANQSPPDVCCYTFNYKQGEAPRSVMSPWKLSKISDFTKWPEICGGAERILVEDRLVTSLAGITSMKTGNSFTAYQLDSHGDIFYQVYEDSDSTDRKQTFNWLPKSGDDHLDEVAVKIGKEWIQNLESQVFKSQKEIADMRKNTGTDVTNLFDEIMTDHPAHVLCSFCMPNSTVYDIDMDQGEVYCHNCQQSLHNSNSILQAVDKDTIVTSKTQQDNTFDNVIGEIDDLETTDALSKLMVKLWNKDQDIQDILVERDEEIKLRRNRKSKNTVKRVKGGESQDESDTPSVSDVEENISLCSHDNMEPPTTGSGVQIRHYTEQRVQGDEESHDSHTGVEVESAGGKSISIRNTVTDIVSCVLGKGDNELAPDKLKLISSQRLDSRKRRYSGSSIGSVSSTTSSKSSRIPGFAMTPIKHKMNILRNSPKKLKHSQSINDEAKESDVDDVYDRDLLQQNLHDSFSMFEHPSTSQSFVKSKSISHSVCKESPTNRPFSNLGTRSPSKSKRKYVSGF